MSCACLLGLSVPRYSHGVAMALDLTFVGNAKQWALPVLFEGLFSSRSAPTQLDGPMCGNVMRVTRIVGVSMATL